MPEAQPVNPQMLQALQVLQQGQAPLQQPQFQQIPNPQDFGNQMIRLLLGEDVPGLFRKGAQNFPQVPSGSPQHTEAAFRAGSRMDNTTAQLLGLLVEGAELGKQSFTPEGAQDTLQDLIQNLLGGTAGAASKIVGEPMARQGLTSVLDFLFPQNQPQ